MRFNFLNVPSINFGIINLISFLTLVIVFSSTVTAAELPSKCKPQTVECLVVTINKKIYAFYWKEYQLFHQTSPDNRIYKKNPLSWNFKNRILSLTSSVINFSIDFKQDRLVTIDREVAGYLGPEFQSIEKAVKVESSKRNAKQKKVIANDFLKNAFNELSIDQKNKIQRVLLFDMNGFYDGNVDGNWGEGTLAALKGFIIGNSLGIKLDPPNNISQAKNLLRLIESFEEAEAEKKRKIAEAEKKRKEAEAEKKRKEAEKKRKEAEADNTRRLLVEQGTVGYKDIRIYMTAEEIKHVAKCDLRQNKYVTCYNLANIKFKGDFKSFPELNKRVLHWLTLDMGPLDSYSWASFLMNWRKSDPESKNVYENMRNILGEKYSLDFEFSERDVTFFDKGERDKLRISYESGQVRLEIIRKKNENGYAKVRLYLTYAYPEAGQVYLTLYTPQKSKASDF